MGETTLTEEREKTVGCKCFFCAPSSYDRLFMDHAMFIDRKPHEGCFFCQDLKGLSEAERFKRFDEFIQARHG